MTQRLRVFIIFFVARFVRHRFKAGAVGALTNLTNQRPSREQRSERCHVVQSSLKRQSLLLRFLWATVKCEKIWGTTIGERLNFVPLAIDLAVESDVCAIARKR